ncbi:hypothetical protein HA050_06125 [Iodobacter sp. HSC-16F04]|uniref:Uncharacterized protein n=1 Tax=Iodobacter violaceini TaxID=3044271 RepID=A0ABX0KX81_9NEIS|nr:hypothetical protein [Iodobacter violacea]NHQ85696.1 hypothetical protein [Iodobacter violacea]
MIKLKVFCLLMLASAGVIASEANLPEEMLRGRNQQYQEGFRDGFREAVRMMNGNQGSQSSDRRKIQILNATYGSARGRCDFTQRLARSANDKSSYRFKSGNQWCGDPSDGYQKMATVEYACRGKVRRAYVREGQSETLRCY